MEIRTFAERILFSNELSDKLERPGRLKDEAPGPGIGPVPAPHRPPGLAFSREKSARTAFPRVSQLDDELARGKVLHFFANHELLALELMALTLLRFPEAPTQFRRRLIATMRDEQKHMSLYLSRMAELGVDFGTVPLNAFFWEQLSTVATPIEFVAGMSLTFEQANLDFSLFYRDAFRTVGDEVTADIMDEVLRDEIAHVRHGVHLFNQWRAPDLSQWEAYQEALRFPLTPARAKGTIFTRSHRRKAGLDEAFIANLEVYSHSRGRRPDVFIFNPDFEAQLVDGQAGSTPPKRVRTLIKDLESLPMFLATQDDVVLVECRPNAPHLSRLKSLGYSVPEFVRYDRSTPSLGSECSLLSRQIATCEPWGWEPRVAERLQPLVARQANHSVDYPTQVQTWRRFASKAWFAERLPRWLEGIPPLHLKHCAVESPPVTLTSLQAVSAYLENASRSGQAPIVIKAPFGSAGRGALRCNTSRLEEREARWVERILDTQGTVVAEPWYERVLDASYLFRVTPDGAFREVGFTRFITDERGRYRGSMLAPLKRCIPDALKPFFYQADEDPDWFWETVRSVCQNIANELIKGGYHGRAGVDLMVIRDRQGEFKLRVPLELNPRPTMGHVASALARPLRSRATGVWLLVTERDCSRSGHEDFEGLIGALQALLPQKNAPDGLGLMQGIFATNEPSDAQQVCGIALVARDLQTVKNALTQLGLTAEW